VISVVIPVKNGGADLARCLRGIAAQRVDEDVEVVAVDSGSTDGSPELARAAGAVVHEIPAEEFGHGRTRNLGVGLARGDLVVFTSQDAVADDEGWLSRLGLGPRCGGRPRSSRTSTPRSRAGSSSATRSATTSR
jgi:rhamnosyltransferase